MRDEAQEKIEEEFEEYDPGSLPDEIDVDITQHPHKPLCDHYLHRDAPGGHVPIARVFSEDPTVAKEIVRRYNAFDDLVGVLQDIVTHTKDDAARTWANQVLEEHNITDRPDTYNPEKYP